MAWGLNGITFSGNMGNELKTKAITAQAKGGLDAISDIINGVVDNVYFYLPEEANALNLTITDETQKIKANPFSGRAFSNGIIDCNGSEDVSFESIGDKKRQLNVSPESAIEYCYNKNLRSSKEDAYGEVVNRNWYLPAIDEMQEIIVAGYSDFSVFQNKFYWSSQPAYHKNFFLYSVLGLSGIFGTAASDVWGDYYYDNDEYARATSAVYEYTDELGKDKYTYEISGEDKEYQYHNDAYDQILKVSISNQTNEPSEIPTDGITIEYWNGEKDGWLIQSPVYIKRQLYKVKYGEGYDNRNTINRVRCVYRSGTVSRN